MNGANTAAVRKTASLLAAGGIVMAIGGQLHPRGTGDTIDSYLIAMTESSTWNIAHLLMLAGLLLGIAGLVTARRGDVFDKSVRPWLTTAIVAWSFGAIELVPHALAGGEEDALRSGAATPFVDIHSMLQVVSTPVVGLSTAALAIAVALSARTRPAWLLAAVATLGGLVYAVAGPLVNLTNDVSFAAMFAAESSIAIWMIGTALRLRSAVSAAPAPEPLTRGEVGVIP